MHLRNTKTIWALTTSVVALAGAIGLAFQINSTSATASSSLSSTYSASPAPISGEQAKEMALSQAVDLQGLPLSSEALKSVATVTQQMNETDAKALVSMPGWFDSLPTHGAEIWVVSVSAYASFDSVPRGYDSLADGYTVMYDQASGAYLGTILGVKLLN